MTTPLEERLKVILDDFVSVSVEKLRTDIWNEIQQNKRAAETTTPMTTEPPPKKRQKRPFLCIAINKDTGLRCKHTRSERKGYHPLLCAYHNRHLPEKGVAPLPYEVWRIQEDDDGDWVDKLGNIWDRQTDTIIGAVDDDSKTKKFFD